MKKIVALALVAACGGPATKPTVKNPDGPAAPPKDLTTAEQVMEAAINAEGGRAAAEKIKNTHMVGTVSLASMGVKGQLEMWAAAPNLSLQHLEIKGMLTDDSGVKGDLAWEKNTMQGARLLEGKEKSMVLRDAIFNGDLQWKTLYPTVTFKGVVKFADQDCYQLELVATDGQAQTRYYTKKDLLPIGAEMIAPSQMGDVPVKVVSSDWREENGFKYPHKVARVEGPQTVEVTIDKIETNIAIPADKFEPPDEVKQLAAKASK